MLLRVAGRGGGGGFGARLLADIDWVGYNPRNGWCSGSTHEVDFDVWVLDDRIVLVRRAIEPGYGKWVFPGGYVDRGEEITLAAIREAAFRTVPGATLSTGAAIITGNAYRSIESDMVDMESYAIKRACDRLSELLR